MQFLSKPLVLFTFPVKVSIFLSLLLSKREQHILPKVFDDCYLSFTKTMRFDIIPCKALLLAAWQQRCAIICPQDYFAVDIIIPVSKKLNPDSPTDFVPLYIHVKKSNPEIGILSEDEEEEEEENGKENKEDTIKSLYDKVFRLKSHFPDFPPPGQKPQRHTPPQEIGNISADPFIFISVQTGNDGRDRKMDFVTMENQPMFIISSFTEPKAMTERGNSLGRVLKMLSTCDPAMKAYEDLYAIESDNRDAVIHYENTVKDLLKIIPSYYH